MISTHAIRERWDTVGSKLDERGQRVFASGEEVRAAGWGGLAVVHEITGLARSTIGRGLKDLDAAPLPKGRVRRKGGGRRRLSVCHSGMELSVVAIIREGDREPVSAKRHGISEQTIYTWLSASAGSRRTKCGGSSSSRPRMFG